MDHSVSKPRERTLDHVDLCLIDSGYFSRVHRISTTSTVVKIPLRTGEPHHVIEKQIYERLGNHPSILQYHGEVLISCHPAPETAAARGLVFDYSPFGQLSKVMQDREEMARHENGYDRSVAAIIRGRPSSIT